MIKNLILTVCILSVAGSLNAQEKLYGHTFPLSSITLSDGLFKQACELNIKVLMKHQGTQSGVHKEESWRNARQGGYFEYEMKTDGREDLSLMIRYWGNKSLRKCSIPNHTLR